MYNCTSINKNISSFETHLRTVFFQLKYFKYKNILKVAERDGAHLALKVSKLTIVIPTADYEKY